MIAGYCRGSSNQKPLLLLMEWHLPGFHYILMALWKAWPFCAETAVSGLLLLRCLGQSQGWDSQLGKSCVSKHLMLFGTPFLHTHLSSPVPVH